MQQYYEVSSLDLTVRKSVIDGVVERVLMESGIEKPDIVYVDSFNTAHQPDSTLGEETNPEYASTERIYVEVSDERDEMSRINRNVGMGNEIPFFLNEVDQVKAWAVRSKYKATVTFRRNAESPDELQRWINRLNSLIDMGRFTLVTEAEAYYYIPKGVLRLLNETYKAAEARVPKFEKFVDYLKAYFHPSVFVAGNVAGGQATLAVRWSPVRMEVVYDTQLPTWDKDENHYESTFTVQFDYERPEEVACVYPYIINQTPLPDEYQPQIDPPWMENEEQVERSPQQKQFDGTWWDNEATQLIILPYLLCPKEQFHRTHTPIERIALPIFGTDVCFGEENMSSPVVCTTDDLPYVWNPVLLPYIEHCRIIDPTGQRGVFRMEMFENGARIEPQFYHWEGEEFSLRNRDIDVTKNYFLTERVIYDWRGMDMFPLSRYPKAAELLVKWLFPKWDTPDWWWELPVLPPSVWDEIEKQTVKPEKGTYLTVFNTSIIAIRGVSDAASEGEGGH